MSSPEIIKMFGGPGTGKTTTLVGNTDIPDFKGILHRMFEEENPSNLMLIAYTRSAADEAKNRLAKLTDINKGVLDKRITTIHSLTMGYNSIYPSKICELRRFQGNNDYKEFCKSVGLTYEASSDDDDIMSIPDDDGHLFFKIDDWLKANMLSLEDWQECPTSGEWRYGDEFVDFGRDWIRYKSRQGAYEFNDAIKMSVEKQHQVDASQLFVDETQDLYPLQQAFLDVQFEVVDRIWFAADDDQTIYEWSGANPQYILDMKPNVNGLEEEYWKDKGGYWDDDGVYILDQSWRMPSEVLELSKLCIEQVENRQEKDIKPHHDGGDISIYRWPSARTIVNEINPEDTFILFRANHQCSNFGQALIELGVPFTDRFKTWRKEVVDLRDGLAAIANDEYNMTGDQAAQVISELPRKLVVNPGKRGTLQRLYEGKSEVYVEDVVNLVKVTPGNIRKYIRNHRNLGDWKLETYNSLNYYQTLAILNNLERDKENMYPDGITIETMHWSKGQEADTVIVSLDSTSTIMEQCWDGMNDAERRLYYVALTRTKNKLVIAETIDEQSPNFTVDELLGEGWGKEYEYTDY